MKVVLRGRKLLPEDTANYSSHPTPKKYPMKEDGLMAR